jgi:FAD-linked oxidoreductase
MLFMKVETAQIIQNWSQTFRSTPEKVLYPSSIEEVVHIIQEANKEKKKVRVIGAGHSFTKLAESKEWLISLDYLSGIESINEEEGTATILAGTRLKVIGEELGKKGYAQKNLGDINVQSIAGAISTGTHGTGKIFGNISSQVEELTIVTGTGEIVTISKDHPHFYASLVSLGMLGIIVKVKIKIIQSPIYHYKSWKMKYVQLEQEMDQLIDENRHFEIYLFPYSDTVQIKTMNITTDAPQSLKTLHLKNLFLENYVLYVLSTISKWIPRTSRSISKLSAWGVGKADIRAYSYQLFATPRLVRFREMEYCIPRKFLKDALREIRATIEINKYNVHFPLEVRTVKADSIWLSPSYKRESAYIAFHMYKGMEYEKYFHDMEELMKKYEGRPHWGKMHNRKKEDLLGLYPKLQDFLKIREEYDPNNIFINDYLHEIFFSR